jgi:hypothetical protein
VYVHGNYNSIRICPYSVQHCAFLAVGRNNRKADNVCDRSMGAELSVPAVQVCATNCFKHSILFACLRNSRYRGTAGMYGRAKQNKRQAQSSSSFCVLRTRITAIYQSVRSLALLPWRLHWGQTNHGPLATQEVRAKYTKTESRTECGVHERI